MPASEKSAIQHCHIVGTARNGCGTRGSPRAGTIRIPRDPRRVLPALGNGADPGEISPPSPPHAAALMGQVVFGEQRSLAANGVLQAPRGVFRAHPARGAKHGRVFPSVRFSPGDGRALAGIGLFRYRQRLRFTRNRHQKNAGTQPDPPWLSPSPSASAYLLRSPHRPNRPGNHPAQGSAGKE